MRAHRNLAGNASVIPALGDLLQLLVQLVHLVLTDEYIFLTGVAFGTADAV